MPNQQDKVNVSDDSSDGNISEESKSPVPFLFRLKSSTSELFVSIIQLFILLPSFVLISGAGLEWEDDFSLLPLPTSSKGSPPDITTKPSLPTCSAKPVARVSRFTVSPSNVSRFSITHVSDSDMDSAGGKKCWFEFIWAGQVYVWKDLFYSK